MTPLRAPKSADGPPLSLASFPHLEAFFSGYLHEDFLVEYGSPEGALRAWRMEASGKEGQQLNREAERLVKAAAALPFDTIAAFVRRDLGSAWRPSDLARLQKLFAAAPKRTQR